MPSAPAYACPTPGCRYPQPCPVHTRESRCTRPNRDVRKWYGLARWRHPVYGRRAQQLAREPLCRACRQRGIVEPGTDADHVIPHDGDADLFWDPENLQTLCHGCHSSKTQSEK